MQRHGARDGSSSRPGAVSGRRHAWQDCVQTKRSSGALAHLLDSCPHSVLPSALTQLLPEYLSSWRRWCGEALAGDAARASARTTATARPCAMSRAQH